MTRVLLIGYDPETVDFSDPVFPLGMNAEKIRAGIAVAVGQFAARGWALDLCYLKPDETAGPAVEHHLAATRYDCVIIGSGVRLWLRRVAVFEAIVNAVHKAAPGTPMAFNTRPDDSLEAATRRLPKTARG